MILHALALYIIRVYGVIHHDGRCRKSGLTRTSKGVQSSIPIALWCPTCHRWRLCRSRRWGQLFLPSLLSPVSNPTPLFYLPPTDLSPISPLIHLPSHIYLHNVFSLAEKSRNSSQICRTCMFSWTHFVVACSRLKNPFKQYRDICPPTRKTDILFVVDTVITHFSNTIVHLTLGTKGPHITKTEILLVVENVITHFFKTMIRFSSPRSPRPRDRGFSHYRSRSPSPF